jgi:CRISPR-associated protein Cas1
MASIYILSDFGKLTKKDETLVFVQKDDTRTILFPFKTEHIVIMGNISISGDALRLLTKYKISTTFLSSNGRFNGKLSFGDSKNVFLRQNQYRILDNRHKSLEIARSIVTGKIKNQISFMQRIKRKSGVSEKMILDAINAVKNALSDAEKTSDIEKLRGFEGIAARHYFSVFGCNIQPEWAEFKKRSRNPPLTNVNAVLSFLYTLLMYRVESAIESQGLDICVGNLHAINYGKNALVFDLMEEFRAAISDSVCCSLFNLGILKDDDFENKCFSEDDIDYPLETAVPPDCASEKNGDEETVKGVLLKKDAIKKVISAFEQKMESMILYAPTGQKFSYQRIIYMQAEHYKRVVSGEETEYKSYYFK